MISIRVFMVAGLLLALAGLYMLLRYRQEQLRTPEAPVARPEPPANLMMDAPPSPTDRRNTGLTLFAFGLGLFVLGLFV